MKRKKKKGYKMISKNDIETPACALIHGLITLRHKSHTLFFAPIHNERPLFFASE
jgi:hypothetical protein